MKVFAGKNVYNYLKDLAGNKMTIPGLLLGQSTKDKSYIIHAVRNLDSTEALAEELTQNIEEFSCTLIDHVQQVTRMLPGGTFVLGLFFICKDNMLANTSDVKSIQSLVKKIKANLKEDESKYFNTILQYNFSNDTTSCALIDSLSKDIMLNVEFKKTNWYHIQCFFDFNDLPSLYFPEDVSLKVQSDLVLKRVKTILDESLFSLNGAFSDHSVSVKSLAGISSRPHCPSVILMNIHLPCEFQENNNKDIYIERSFVTKIICSGILGSNVYLNEEATVDDAILAVKNDILRSLSSRTEMHLDSLLEGEVNFQEMRTVHEPPRRILINLPDVQVQLSDYLFPGESLSELSEALESLRELLDIDINPTTIEKNFEGPSDINEENAALPSTCTNPSEANAADGNSFKIPYKKILIISLFIVLVAIVYQLLQSGHSGSEIITENNKTADINTTENSSLYETPPETSNSKI
uniref:Protein odr-4 homolog n=1 Tax=Cacopsylla melanoneura TaxID=428564 RepID=A0A8D8QVM7_9HEMI